MNSAVPFVNCVQIKYPNPRRMNERSSNAEDKKVNKNEKQEWWTNETRMKNKINKLFNSVIFFLPVSAAVLVS